MNVKSLVKSHPLVNFIIFTNVSDTLYAPPGHKIWGKTYLSKTLK